MSTERNKKIALSLLARIGKQDLERMRALLTEDATWTLAGRPKLLPIAGTHPVERILRIMRAANQRLPSGLKFAVKSQTAEGDRVVIEAESRGPLKDGRTYNQHYVFIFEFRGERICAVREYFDTQYGFRIWHGAAAQRQAQVPQGGT